MPDFETEHPRLRLVDAQPIQYEGATYILLRDPLELTEKTILVPQPLVPMLAMCDGTRSLSALRGALALRYGLFLTPDRILSFLTALDDALLLENRRSQAAREDAQAVFRQAPYRAPANAGLSYPDKAEELAKYLQGYLDDLDGALQPAPGVRGIISPHIDFERGGPVYARVWGPAAGAVQNAELAIIFGTDHFSEGYPISLTRQNYATPFGVLPTALDIVDRIAEVVGPQEAFRGELHHRREHSIELAAVWMHHMRGGKPIEVVPILTGGLGGGEAGARETQAKIEALLVALRESTAGVDTIVIAAGDLAHVGPAFGGEPVNPDSLAALRLADDELIDAMCAGNAQAFYEAVERVQDANNVCGVSPIYLALRLLASQGGENHGYAVCPADNHNTSVVTICGITLK